MEKVEKDGLIAVLYTSGYGAGWSTWNDDEDEYSAEENRTRAETLCMDARIVQPVLDGDRDAAISMAEYLVPGAYTGGGRNLSVRWVTKGSSFSISDYDGWESVATQEDLSMVA